MYRAAVASLGLSLIVLLSGTAWAEDITYRKHIRPLWENRCAECHGSDAPYYGDFSEEKDRFIADDIGPRMDSYAALIFFIGWPDTGAMMRRLDDGQATADRKPGNMYEHLGDDEAQRQQNLKLFKAWVGEDAWNLNRWNARGDVPAITKEELNKLKLKY
ncbi:MAG TPA: hypothetical protein VMM76_04500 [Pirellulaceae bacterium]|nr:hypothetical protein [Pirellulaceae bacterium]